MFRFDHHTIAAQTLFFEDDGSTPNSRYPVLLYRLGAVAAPELACAFEALFAAHQWTPLWRDGIFDYHHFHPNAHEALGVVSGHARVILGGPTGQTLNLEAGDVVVLPAGTGHCCIASSDDFVVVGAYPQGQEAYDTQRPDPSLHHQALARIAAVPDPALDPVTGKAMTQWQHGKSHGH